MHVLNAEIISSHQINENDPRMPPYSDMNAKIEIKDESLLPLLNELVKKYKFDGISSKFV